MPKIPRRLYTPRGRKKPPNAKIIDRRSDWGSPHIVGSPGVPDRATATRLYERDLLAGKLRGYKSGRLLTVETAQKNWPDLILVAVVKMTVNPVTGTYY